MQVKAQALWDLWEAFNREHLLNSLQRQLPQRCFSVRWSCSQITKTESQSIIISHMQSTWLQLDCLRRIFGGRCLPRKSLNNTSMPFFYAFSSVLSITFFPTHWPRTPGTAMPSADDGRDGRDGHRDEKKRRPKEAAEGEASSSGALSADAEAWWNPVGPGRNFLGTCPLLQNLWVSYLHM